MIEVGLWRDRKQREKRVHQPGSRRDCVGELVQVDGGEHWWVKDRGPQCALLVFADDANSRMRGDWLSLWKIVALGRALWHTNICSTRFSPDDPRVEAVEWGCRPRGDWSASRKGISARTHS